MRLEPWGLAVCVLAWWLSAADAGAQAHQWERVEVGGGETAFVAVAVDADEPTRLLAASRHALYESLDGGDEWWVRFRVPQQATVTGIAAKSTAAPSTAGGWRLFGFPRDTTDRPTHPITLLATDHGLYGSFDGGKRWLLVFHGATDAARQCTHVAFHPSQARTALLGTRDGLFLNADDGKHWTQLNLPLAARDVIHFAWDPDEVSHLYLTSAGGLFVGSLPNGPWERRVSVLGAEDTVVEQPESGVTNETDEETGSLHRLSALAIDPQHPATLYLAGDQGLAVSTDAGVTWTRPARVSAEAGAITHLLLQHHSPLVLYAATSRGVAGYDPEQGRWKTITAGLTTSHVNDLVASSTHLWAATEEGLYRYEIPPDLFDEREPPTAQALLENFVHEPTIGEVRDATIRYAEVHPDKIKRWRRQACLKALLPTVDIGAGRDHTDNVTVDQGTFPKFQLIDTQDQKSGLDLSIKWALGDLIWSDAQTSIDVRSKLMVQLRNDIVDQVTRTYFERRRLQAAMLNSPPSDQPAMLEQELRLQELTALIDGLTGGYFSERMKVDGNQEEGADGTPVNGVGGQAAGEVRR